MKHTTLRIAIAALAAALCALPAAAAIYPFQTTQYQLCGNGSTAGDTTICLQSMSDINGVPVTMSNFGALGFGTVDPNNGGQEESVTWTGVTQNANGTATLTGVNSVSFAFPFTLYGNVQKNHAGAATFVVSNTSYFYYRQFASVDNPETITGQWAFPYPNASSSVATEGYVLNTIAGTSTLAFNKTVVQGTAGQGMATGTLVYFNGSTQTWKDVNASTPGTYQDQEIGLAQASTTSGQGINGGVLVKGLDNSLAGLVPGANYFASTTAGLLGLATTSQEVGVALDSTHLYFDPYFVRSKFVTLAGNNTYTGTTTFQATTSVTIGAFPAWQIGKNMQVVTTTGTSTLALPQGVNVIHVRMCATGGEGTSKSGGTPGHGGGAGGYAEGMVNVTGTTSIQVAIIGASNAASNTAGGDTWFGTPGFAYMVARGGGADQTAGAATIIASTTGFAQSGNAGTDGTAGNTAGNSGVAGQGSFGAYCSGGNNGDSSSNFQGIIIVTW